MIVRDVVAIVDDEPLVLRALQRILGQEDPGILTASGDDDLDRLVADPRLAVVVLDLFLDGRASGPERIQRILRRRPDVAVVVMTGRPSVDSAVACIRAGAFDYLCKPFTDVARVREVVRAARAQASRSGAGRESRRDGGVQERPAGTTSDWVRVPLVGEPVGLAAVPLSLDAYERLALERALREAAGDAAEAARRLGIGRSTFYRKAAKHGVDLRRAEATAGGGSRDDGGSSRRVGEGPAIG